MVCVFSLFWCLCCCCVWCLYLWFNLLFVGLCVVIVCWFVAFGYFSVCTCFVSCIVLCCLLCLVCITWLQDYVDLLCGGFVDLFFWYLFYLVLLVVLISYFIAFGWLCLLLFCGVVVLFGRWSFALRLCFLFGVLGVVDWYFDCLFGFCLIVLVSLLLVSCGCFAVCATCFGCLYGLLCCFMLFFIWLLLFCLLLFCCDVVEFVC